MRYLLDTCVVSELVKKHPNPELTSWLDAQDETDLYLSVITLGEFHKGIHKLRDTDKTNRLQTWINNDLTLRFKERILEVNLEITNTWGEILGKAEQRGETLPSIDALIAATAIFHNLIVITRNTKDLNRCGVTTKNPWG